MAFVPQEDLLFSNLTVRETLETSAALRLPRGTTRAARAEAVEGLLGKLGLRQCADSRVGDVAPEGRHLLLERRGGRQFGGDHRRDDRDPPGVAPGLFGGS